MKDRDALDLRPRRRRRVRVGVSDDSDTSDDDDDTDFSWFWWVVGIASGIVVLLFIYFYIQVVRDEKKAKIRQAGATNRLSDAAQLAGSGQAKLAWAKVLEGVDTESPAVNVDAAMFLSNYCRRIVTTMKLEGTATVRFNEMADGFERFAKARISAPALGNDLLPREAVVSLKSLLDNYALAWRRYLVALARNEGNVEATDQQIQPPVWDINHEAAKASFGRGELVHPRDL